MIPSQTIKNLIKYNIPKKIIIWQVKIIYEQMIQNLHNWWDKGYIKPEEIDEFPNGNYTYTEIENKVDERLVDGFYEYITESYNDEFLDYGNMIEWAWLYTIWIDGDIDWEQYRDGYYYEEEEEEAEWINGCIYYLLKIRNSRWNEYGGITFPW